MSSLSIAGCFGHLRQLLGRFAPAADRPPPDPACTRGADPRTAATISLLAVIVCAASTFALPPRPGAIPAKPGDDVVAGGTAGPAGPVRIVGATPRSDDCREQVWPYIEQRCLTRVERPTAKVEVAAPIAAETRERVTAGAAPVARETAALPATPARFFPATARLALPVRRSDPVASAMPESASDGLWLDEPRRHGRRAQRFRTRHRGFSLFPF